MMVGIVLLINWSNLCLKDLLISFLIFKEIWKGRCSVFGLECHISFFRMRQGRINCFIAAADWQWRFMCGFSNQWSETEEKQEQQVFFSQFYDTEKTILVLVFFLF